MQNQNHALRYYTLPSLADSLGGSFGGRLGGFCIEELFSNAADGLDDPLTNTGCIWYGYEWFDEEVANILVNAGGGLDPLANTGECSPKTTHMTCIRPIKSDEGFTLKKKITRK